MELDTELQNVTRGSKWFVIHINVIPVSQCPRVPYGVLRFHLTPHIMAADLFIYNFTLILFSNQHSINPDLNSNVHQVSLVKVSFTPGQYLTAQTRDAHGSSPTRTAADVRHWRPRVGRDVAAV